VTRSVFLRFWLPVLLYTSLIFVLSSMSHPPIPSGISGDSLHYPEYATLAFLLARALQGNRSGVARPSYLLGAFVLSILFGATDEFHQAFVPDRVPDVQDWLHDGIGAAVGAFSWAIWRWIRR
jgi:VanZ family protein